MNRRIIGLGTVICIVVVFGTIYAAVQQAQRSSANSPQIQIAEDAAESLNHGTPPIDLLSGQVDVTKSLAPFVIIYDRTGRVVGGTGSLNGSVPKVPFGVLTTANGRPYNAVTWQPQTGTRVAVVTVAASHYYVLSGRSLTEVEHAEDRTWLISVAGAMVTIAILLLVLALGTRVRH